MEKKSRRLLICSSHLFPPQFYGGAQSSVQQMCFLLRERGYDARVLCRLNLRGIYGLKHRVIRRLLGRKYTCDNYGGFEKVRCWDVLENAAFEVNRFKPDLVIADAGNTIAIARKFVDLGIPTIAMIRDVEFREMGDDFFTHKLLCYAANSMFTMKRLEQTFGIHATVVHPIIDANSYRTTPGDDHVLQINTAKKKGIETTLKLAEFRSDIKFVIYHAWHIDKELQRRYRGVPNVKFRNPRNNASSVYSGAKLLLVPSVWEEAWGRVVSEAQISGIPVIATKIGGLPESVGKGGLLIPPEAPIDAWLEALSVLWDDQASWSEYSRAALEHANRKEIDPVSLIERLIKLIEEHIGVNENKSASPEISDCR